MLGVFAEFERATLIERVIAGMERKAASGGWNGGNVPYGYDKDPETGFLMVNERDSLLVVQVFELYVSGKLGTVSIARWLNQSGYRTKQGTLWRAKSVRRLLTNRAYLGEVLFRERTYPGKHPAIIDQSTFDGAQELLAERGEDCSKRRSNASDYLLSGSLLCARCSRRFTGTIATGKGGRYRYYTCASRVQYGTGRCDQPRLRADILEGLVIEHLLRSLRDGKVLSRSIDKSAKGFDRVRPRLQEELGAVRMKLKESRTAMDKYLRAFETGSMPADVCAPRVAELDELIHDLEKRHDELEIELTAGKETVPDLEELRNAASDWADQVEVADVPVLKRLIRTLMPEIHVESRSRIRPIIRLARVRVKGRWVGPRGLEPRPPD